MSSAAVWPSRRLGDLLETIIDYRGKTPPKAKTGIPTLTAANVRSGRLDLSDVSYISTDTYDKWTTRGLPKPGDVLITTEAPIGEVASFPGDGTYLITRRLMALRGRQGALDNQFLKYMLMSPRIRRELLSAERGSTVPRILKTDVTGLMLPIPDYETQARIAHILGMLDNKIELNRRMNQTLEAIARTIFKSWFVDFDPVHAKAEGRKPVGMDPETAALFPDSFQDSPLGRIPKGWTVERIGSVVRNIRDKVDPTPEKDHERYVALDDMRPKSVCLDAWRAGEAVNSSIIRFRRNDILFGSMRPYFHKVGLALFDGITRATTFVLRPIVPDRRLFALFHLSSTPVIDFSTSASVGSTIPYVKWDALSGYQIALPPSDLLGVLERDLGPIAQKMNIASSESACLVAARDTLLPELLSSRLEVVEGGKAE